MLSNKLNILRTRLPPAASILMAFSTVHYNTIRPQVLKEDFDSESTVYVTNLLSKRTKLDKIPIFRGYFCFLVLQDGLPNVDGAYVLQSGG